MEGLILRYAQAPLPQQAEEEEAEEVVEEEAVEEEVEVEGEALEEHSLNPPSKETSESKERRPKSSRETAPKLKSSLKTYEATSV